MEEERLYPCWYSCRVQYQVKMSGPSDPSAGSDATGSASNSSEKPAGNESRTDDSSVKFINSLSVSLSRHIVKNSQEYDSRVILPPALSLSRKRAATSNIRHYFTYKKPRVSQQLGQAIKSIIRRRIISANLSGDGGKNRARSDSFGNTDSILPAEGGSAAKAVDVEASSQAAEQQSQEEVNVKNETSDLYTEEDLIKVNLEIETLSKSIVELKAKKKEQFLELKAMLTAERKRQKRAAEEAAERHRQLALAAASAAESLQVENAPMRAMMANKPGNPMPLNNHGRPKQ